MKRILVMGMSKDRGGMETCIMNYYRHIDRSKFQFDFISYNEPPYCVREIEALGGRCFVIPGRFVSYRKNKKELKDFFHTHGHEYEALWYNCCLISDLTLFKAAAKYRIPKKIVHAHNSKPMGHAFSNWLHTKYKNRITKYATDFWACSQEAGKFFYSDGILQSRQFRVITNAIETKEFCFRPQVRQEIRQQLALQDRFVLGNVARMDPEKNQLMLLEIFSRLHKQRADSVLLLIGQGRLENELKARTKELNLEDSVLFLGQRHDVARLYCAMDAFLLPSEFEGLPMTLIEAQACGLPSFTSTEAVPPEAAVTPLLHFISLAESPEKWAEAIVKECADTNTAERAETEKILADSRWNIKQAALLLEELF